MGLANFEMVTITSFYSSITGARSKGSSTRLRSGLQGELGALKTKRLGASGLIGPRAFGGSCGGDGVKDWALEVGGLTVVSCTEA